MGGSGSKPAGPAPPTPGDIKFTPDYSTANIGVTELQRQLQAAQVTAQQQAKLAVEAVQKPLQQSVSTWQKLAIWGVLLTAVAFGLIFLADYISIKTTGHELSGFGWLAEPIPPAPSEQSILFIDSATYYNDADNSQDVTTHIQSLVQNDTTLPGFVVSYSALGLTSDLAPSKATPPALNTLKISYHLCGDPPGTYTQTANSGMPFPTLPLSTDTCKTSGGVKSTAPVASPPPSFGSRMYNAIFGDSSGDLAPSYHDASSSAIIQGNRAPLSAESEGGYGMQWWMYVKDWNYGYGKKKSVVKRPDTTNSSVTNPHISLHPTDNTLQISVSVFPASEGGASKSAPAPAGHSGSTDDVFVCDVPNIPLQTWFSVSVTVFGRNLDVYIDGKLVKSCFLTGVPKPAVGDIQLTPEGGFSGRICNFYHYPRMLTPADAMTFYSAGTSCRSKTESGVAGKTTGYSVKFGVYDSLGKNINEYTF